MAYEHDRITGNAQDYRRVPDSYSVQESRGAGGGVLAAIILAVVVGAGIYAFSGSGDRAVAPDGGTTTIINEPAAPLVPVTPDASVPAAPVPAQPELADPAAPAVPAEPVAPAPVD